MKKLSEDERKRRISLRNKRWYDNKRKDGTLDDYYKQKYAKNKEYTKAKTKEYYNSNKSTINETLKVYRRSEEGQIKSMLARVMARCKKGNIPFDLTIEDIFIPQYCPVLNIELKVGDGKTHDSSPSLDRIVPELGYIKNNVIVVSHKANRIKNNAKTCELKRVYEFYEKLGTV